jgi:hypothetical protein
VETERLTVYFVNGELQRSGEDDLTVRAILERADFKPADQYRLARDHPHHTYTDLDEVVEIHQEERFTALFEGVTPTS